MIEIDILINNTVNEAIKVSKTDWTLFQSNLLEVKAITYNIWDIKTIELESTQLLNSLTSALKKSKYFKTIKSHQRPNKWWSNSLQLLKARVIKLAKKMHSKHGTDEDRNMFLLAKKHFQREVRKSKRNSWKKFLSEIEDPASMTLLTKVLGKNHRSL